MEEMTVEQQRAIAVAKARLRLQSQPKAAPNPAVGVSDPTREMSAPQLGDALSAEYLSGLLGPFSARGPENAQGQSSWQVPPLIENTARTAISSLGMSIGDQIKSLVDLPASLLEHFRGVASSDPRERAAASGQLTLEAPPLIEGARMAGSAARTAIANSSIPQRLISGAGSARAAVANINGRVPLGATDAVVQAAKTAVRPVVNTAARLTEGTAKVLAGKPATTALTFPETDIPRNAAGQIESPVRKGTDQYRPQYSEREPIPSSGEKTVYKPAPDTGLPSTPAPKTLTAPELNKWMNVREKQLIYGNNPAEQIIKDKLLGPDKAATLENVTAARQSAGKLMEAAFKSAESKGVRFNLDSEIQDAVADARKTYGAGSDEAFMKQLDNLQDQFVQHNGDLKNATPSEAHTFEKDLSKGINWESAATSDIGRVLKDIRGRVSRLLKRGVPEIAGLKDRWGNLYEAEKSLKSSLRKDAIGRGTGDTPNGR